MKSQRLAVGLMIGQAILFAVETAMIHHIGPRGSAMQLALLRSGAGVTLVALLAWNTGWSVIKTAQLPLQLLRGFVSVAYLWVLMYSFAHMPFADATAIAYTQAAYIAVFSALILNETRHHPPMDGNRDRHRRRPTDRKAGFSRPEHRLSGRFARHQL